MSKQRRISIEENNEQKILSIIQPIKHTKGILKPSSKKIMSQRLIASTPSSSKVQCIQSNKSIGFKKTYEVFEFINNQGKQQKSIYNINNASDNRQCCALI